MHLNWPRPFPPPPLPPPLLPTFNYVYFLPREDHSSLSSCSCFFSFLSIDGKSNFTNGKLIISFFDRERLNLQLSNFANEDRATNGRSFLFSDFSMIFASATRDNGKSIGFSSKIFTRIERSFKIKFRYMIFSKTMVDIWKIKLQYVYYFCKDVKPL